MEESLSIYVASYKNSKMSVLFMDYESADMNYLVERARKAFKEMRPNKKVRRSSITVSRLEN